MRHLLALFPIDRAAADRAAAVIASLIATPEAREETLVVVVSCIGIAVAFAGAVIALGAAQ